ncbi:uncharacterized protein EI90DRAFT_3041579 [Cantharellus anzutake]|uniref:uncharacterized protein n=1 Tax=Cantharellus anzutake TaxID=1750568 RepID=UPI0019048730|nr:uncharacterized protein EI90DRAFT_3041579 [Cantharellus anzutake]KAF8338089.1 hypothetical protein EI90DRAFT_3041579 [Cantharellus anzutake]
MFTLLTKLPIFLFFLAAFGASFSVALPTDHGHGVRAPEPTMDAYAKRLELLKGPLAAKDSSKFQIPISVRIVAHYQTRPQKIWSPDPWVCVFGDVTIFPSHVIIT